MRHTAVDCSGLAAMAEEAVGKISGEESRPPEYEFKHIIEFFVYFIDTAFVRTI